MPPTPLMGHAACVVLGLALGTAAAGFAAVSPAPLPTGPRGASRRELLERSAALRVLDAILRRMAALLRPVLPAPRRAALEQRLARAGDPLGLSAEEWVAACVLVAAAGAALGRVFAGAAGWGGRAVLASALLGALGCVARVRALAEARQRAADRELPACIDLIAMCMGAGMDFPAAVRLVAGRDTRSVVAVELGRLLRDLSLGRTRQEALRALEQRLPSAAVSDFVAAVVQADQKGSPLAEVLASQAVTSRNRRSVATEEAAARAGVLMIVPLMLLMGCIVLLLVGPLIVTGASP
jgi:tight adherence protein C